VSDDFADGWTKALGNLAAGLGDAVGEAVAEGAKTARSTHRFVNRTGDAEASIEAGNVSHSSEGATAQIECSVPYAAVLANGSKAHVIEAKDGGMLAWQGEGGDWRRAKRVNHPGTKADPFMDNAMAKADATLESAIDRAIDAAFGAAGFD